MQTWMRAPEPRLRAVPLRRGEGIARRPLADPALLATDTGIPVPRPSSVPAVVARLTPFTGLDLLVELADAVELLTPQISAPERLQSSHRLPCKADVFATRRDAPWEAILAAVVADAERAAPVTPLTPALAGRLGLEPFLRAPQPVLCLTVIEDPTDIIEESASVSTPVVAAPVPDDAIVSRREARRAARRARTWRRSWLGRIGAWFQRRRVRRERRRWFARLANRPLYDQLWSVRPTRALLLDPACRRWIRDALALAGRDRDPKEMMQEWEIHWRQQGV